MADPPATNAVKRADTDSTDHTAIELKSYTVYFQRFPGVVGDDTQRGIAGVAFKLWRNGADATPKANTTDAAGMVKVRFAEGEKVELEIFDTKYQISKIALEPDTSPRGAQRRLEMLGYEPDKVSGYPTVAFDAAVCAFQTDTAGLTRMGLLNVTTLDARPVQVPMPDGTTQVSPPIKTAEQLFGDGGATVAKLDAALGIKAK